MEISIGGPSWAEVATAIGTCAGTLFVTAGVIVAIVQLRAITANEVIRSTIDYVRNYESPLVITATLTTSPSQAISDLFHILQHEGRIAAYRTDVKQLFAETLLAARGPEVHEQTRRVSNSIATIGNYFVVADALLRRRRLDECLFLDMLSEPIICLGDAVKNFHDVDRNAEWLYNHERFPDLVRKAKQHTHEDVATGPTNETPKPALEPAEPESHA